MNWMIATESNEPGPVFEADHDEPIWSLYSDEPPGFWWGEWKMSRYAVDVTYPEALRLARNLGFTGAPIGGHVSLV